MQIGIPARGVEPRSAKLVRIAAALLEAVLLVAGLNAIYVAFASQYDWRLGPVHLVAHGIFKPLLILSASFTLTILFRMTTRDLRNLVTTNEPAMPPRFLSVAVVVFGTYAVSFWINYHITIPSGHTPISALLTPRCARSRSISTAGSMTASTGLSAFCPYGRIGGLSAKRLPGITFKASFCIRSMRCLYQSCVESSAIEIWPRRRRRSFFAVSPPSFEAVIWPGARFDEIATLFSLLALAQAIRYIVEGRFRTLAAASGCLVLGLASKESAYAVPPLLVVLWLRRRAGGGCGSGEIQRWTRMIASALAVALAAVLFRFLVLGGVGGYGSSLHFAINPKTFTSLMERAPLASQFAVDGTVHLPWWIQAALILFVVLLLYVVRTCRPDSRNGEWWLPALLLVALLPTANVITFLGPSLVQCRYLYFGSAWSAIFLGAVLPISGVKLHTKCESRIDLKGLS